MKPITALFCLGVVACSYANKTDNIDLDLPQWGPYSTSYAGISHIDDPESGMRFDLSVFPSFYRKSVTVPNVRFESSYMPWQASKDLKNYSYRHQLIWKDDVYSDVKYLANDAGSRIIETTLVNNTDKTQSLAQHFIASINYPKRFGWQVTLPEKGIWVDGTDYAELVFANPSFRDTLPYDNWLRGEVRGSSYINSTALGGGNRVQGFAGEKGDRAKFIFNTKSKINDAVAVFRYRLNDDKAVNFKLTGIADKSVSFDSSNDFAEKIVDIGELKEGEHYLQMVAGNGGDFTLDGFAIVSKNGIDKLKFSRQDKSFKPEILEGPIENSVILKYQDVDTYYGLAWQYAKPVQRHYQTDNFDTLFKESFKSHHRDVFGNDKEGHFLEFKYGPINLAANEKFMTYSLVNEGNLDEVTQQLKQFGKSIKPSVIAKKAETNFIDFKPIAEGEKYLFSQERMAATTLGNVIYPVYSQGQYIKHNVPGKFWQSLYTWDAGFIGLGLAELDIDYAIGMLDQYVNSMDSDSSFTHHGSTVPTQVYLFQEIWNKTGSLEFLKRYYPRIKKMHQFLAGEAGSSSTKNLQTHLLRPWDYFYNSGGWDDYPPQHHLISHPELYKSVTPVINTAQAIRTAKILRLAAQQLGFSEDVALYNQQITQFQNDLLRYSWDKKSGYFSYVMHDKNGKAKKFFRHESGENFNKGLDGLYPLVSGGFPDKHNAAMLQHLNTKGEIWSEVGLSTVDQSAGYYREDGYWNGTVWMPHQWFFWKAMLDLGEGEFARKIAMTALDVWQEEVASTYYTFEHFVINTQRAGGFHHFSGLSTPVLSWFKAYFVPGTLTAGFDTWITDAVFNDDNSELTARLTKADITSDSEKISASSIVLVCMNPEYSYQVYFNGQKADHQELHNGSLQIELPQFASGELVIKAVN